MIYIGENLIIMNLIERAKNILTNPKQEWEVINGEEATPMTLLTTYVIPMVLIGAIAGFIGYGFIGINYGFGIRIKGLDWGLYHGISTLISGIISFFVSSYVIDALAPTFKSEKNINKSAQLVAYSSTAFWVVAILMILPALAILMILGLYSVYLFYLGISVMKKTPEDQKIVYMVVSALVMIVVSLVINFILQKILMSVFGLSLGGMLGL